MSIITALSGCQLDNGDAKKVPADFNNEFQTQVGFDGTKSEGLEVELTTGHGSAEGVIGVTDVNFGEADPDYSLIPEAMYGTFTMTEEDDGAWTYDLDEEHTDVAAIMDNSNGSLTDTITLTSVDGTTADLKFIIKGVDADAEPEFRGDFVANVSLKETDGFGRAQIYDPNFEQSFFQEKGDAKYGSFTIFPDGRWEYELDNRHPDLQDLTEPTDSTSETFTVYSKDGTAKEFTVNITGAPLNFAAKIPSSMDETNVFAINFLHEGVTQDDVANGKMLFKVKATEDLATTAKFGMTCSRWNGNLNGGGDNRRLAQFYLTPEQQIEMWSGEIAPGGSYDNGSADYAKNENDQYITKNVVFDQMHIPGEWTDVEMSWDYNANTQLTKLTLSFNDTPASSDHGAIPADPTAKIVAQTVAGSSLYKCMEEVRFFIQGNEENGGIGALLVDDIQLHTNIDADLKFDPPAFEETFSNSNAGDSVKDAGNPRYENITTDNIEIIRDL